MSENSSSTALQGLFREPTCKKVSSSHVDPTTTQEPICHEGNQSTLSEKTDYNNDVTW